MGPPTDEELMARFQGGDAASFDALFTRHAPGVQAFLLRMVRDRALAEDLLQMTFLSVVRSQDRFQAGALVAPWLFSIAANTARDALRRRGRQAEAPMDEAVHQSDGAVPSDPALARRIQAALDALPDPQREAVVLHRLLGWSFEDMAQALGCTSVAVRIRAHRGYERLRELLGPLLEDV